MNALVKKFLLKAEIVPISLGIVVHTTVGKKIRMLQFLTPIKKSGKALTTKLIKKIISRGNALKEF